MGKEEARDDIFIGEFFDFMFVWMEFSSWSFFEEGVE